MGYLEATNVSLIQTAAYFDLTSKDERKRSAAELRGLCYSVLARLNADCVFEIGAREGTFSRQARKLVPAAEIFAFEANPHSFKRFGGSRWERYGVTYLHNAISDTDGEVTFHLQRRIGDRQIALDSSSNSLMQREGDVDLEEITVASLKLDSFVASNSKSGRFACWIDVEGAIGKVLDGARATLKDTVFLMCEVESRRKWADQLLFSDVQRLLAEYGLVAVARDFEATAQFNVLFVREDRLDAVMSDLERYHSALARNRPSALPQNC